MSAKFAEDSLSDVSKLLPQNAMHCRAKLSLRGLGDQKLDRLPVA